MIQNKWSKQEEKTLKHMFKKLTEEEISVSLNRSKSSIHNKIIHLKFRKTNQQQTEESKKKISIGKMIYKKQKFSGDNYEKAYMYGFWLGDMSSRLDGQQIRVSASSTRKSFVTHFKKLFKNYGHVWTGLSIGGIDPRGKKKTYPDYKMYVLLDKSFMFLLGKKIIPTWINNKHIIPLVSGFFDAEGCVRIVNRKTIIPGGDCSLYISQKNKKLLENFKELLILIGVHSTIHKDRNCWRLNIYADSTYLAKMMLPCSKLKNIELKKYIQIKAKNMHV